MPLSPEVGEPESSQTVAHPTRCIRVRAWQADDAAALAVAADFPDVARWLRDRFPHPYTLADARYFLAEVVPAARGIIRAIEVDGLVAGGIGIEPGDDVYRIAGELGYWLSPAYWRQGIMPAVLAACVPAMAEGLGLRRVHARVYQPNTASMRVLERSGFVHEGVQRQAVIKAGAVMDLQVYVRLFPERPA